MPIESAGEVVFQGGPAGTDGQSTYQAWLALGNVGSIADFIAAQRGAPGPANALTIGAVSTGAPGSSASATITGQSPNQILNMTVPQGATGAQPWQTPPTAWATSTAYTATAPASSVTYGGESYVCATSHTSAQAFDASKWTKIAQKGADGSPAAGAVLYSAAQTLSPAQQIQARTNIGSFGKTSIYLNADTSLSQDDAGKGIFVDNATVTLPDPALIGMVFPFSTGNGANIVASKGGFYLGSKYSTSINLKPQDTLLVVSDSGNWIAYVNGRNPDAALLADRVQSFTDAQKAQLLANAGLLIPQAQCRLVYVSGGQVKLVPWNGNKIWINGAYRTLPADGVSLSTAGLGNNTFWPIVAVWTGSAITLSGVNLPMVVDPTYGIRTTQGYPDQTYVGAVLTDANYNFRDDDAFRGVASLFNAPRRTLSGIIAANGSTASTAGVTLGSPLQFVLAEPTGCDFSTAGYTYNEVGGQFCRTDITLDQAAAGYPCLATSATNNADCAISAHYAGTLAAGAHAVNLFGTVSGGTGHWNAALFGVLG